MHQEENRKRERRTSTTIKLKFLCSVYSTLRKISKILRVAFYNTKQTLLVSKQVPSLCYDYPVGAPIPYVQMAILNLPHPYIKSITVLPFLQGYFCYDLIFMSCRFGTKEFLT